MTMKKANTRLNSTDVIDLKAELLKTQEKFKSSKSNLYRAESSHPAQSQDVVTTKLDSKFINALSNKDKARLKSQLHESLKTQSSDFSKDLPNWDTIKTSLEKKEQIYEDFRRTGGNTDLNEEAQPLVDFITKKYNEIQDDEDEQYIHRDSPSLSPPHLPMAQDDKDDRDYKDDDMVEITDEFGRTRHVSYDYMPDSDPYDSDSRSSRSPSPRPLVEHFDTSKEVRTMGVGYYKFSANEQDRRDQLAALRTLREETIRARSSKVAKQVSVSRKRMERRLRLIKMRRKILLGPEKAQHVKWITSLPHDLNWHEL